MCVGRREREREKEKGEIEQEEVKYQITDMWNTYRVVYYFHLVLRLRPQVKSYLQQ